MKKIWVRRLVTMLLVLVAVGFLMAAIKTLDTVDTPTVLRTGEPWVGPCQNTDYYVKLVATDENSATVRFGAVNKVEQQVFTIEDHNNLPEFFAGCFVVKIVPDPESNWKLEISEITDNK